MTESENQAGTIEAGERIGPLEMTDNILRMILAGEYGDAVTELTELRTSLLIESNKREAILRWMLAGDVGRSSMSMALVALGLKDGDWLAPPQDPSDFARCYRLVAWYPFVRESFPAIAEACPAFRPILDDWDNLCRIYTRDWGAGKMRSADLYLRIRGLLGGEV
jgi:hypothetical protein